MEQWEQKVVDICALAHKKWQGAIEVFNAATKKYGIPEAIIWYGEGVSKAQTVWSEVEAVSDLMKKSDIQAEEKRRRLQAWLCEKKRKQMEGFDLSGSSSVFACAVENAQTEELSQMWRGAGAFARIEKILRETQCLNPSPSATYANAWTTTANDATVTSA